MKYLLLLLSLSIWANNNTKQITVEITGMGKRRGPIKVAISQGADAFLLEAFQRERFRRNGRLVEKVIDNTQRNNTVSFKYDFELYQDYAISVLVDENNNDELDVGLFGPKELYGFSNNARPMFRAATYQEASFVITPESLKIIRIQVR